MRGSIISISLLAAMPVQPLGVLASSTPVIEPQTLRGAEALPQPERQSLWQAFSEARREIRPLADHAAGLPENEGVLYVANNPGQHITARFHEDGARIRSGQPDRDWQGTLGLAGAGEPIVIRRDGTTLEYEYANGFVEWYRNRRNGIEHGYTIPHAPESTGSTLVLAVAVNGLTAQPAENGLVFSNRQGIQVLAYSDLKVWDAEARSLLSTMAPSASGLTITVDVAEARYPIVIDPLITTLEAKVEPSPATGSGAPSDNFGISVSIDGDTALIGAHEDDDNGDGSGSAYIFVRDPGTNTWSVEAKLLPSDGAADDRFGEVVSLRDGTALIGAWADDDGGNTSGSAYIFVRDPGTNTWSQQAKLTAADAAVDDRFGIAVSTDGSNALVGAYFDDDNGSNSGSAYIFIRDPGTNTWSQQAKLVAADGDDSDQFGGAVSIDTGTAIVAARFDEALGNFSGSAYVFVRDPGTNTWSQQAKLNASDGVASDQFGGSVSIDGESALIGAVGDDDLGGLSGSAYVFVRDPGTNTWSQEFKLIAGDGTTADTFGRSVSIEGGTALIGADGDDDLGSTSGSAYLFSRDPGTNTWSQQAKFTAADGDESDRFGTSVSLGGGSALVGANTDENDGTHGGSAYVFVPDPGTNTWSQQAKLAAGDGVSGMHFGNSVSLDDDTALVGASFEDVGSGRVYLFERDPGTNTWALQAVLGAADGAPIDFFGSSVSLHGDTVLIGASQDDDNGDDSGSAYVFVRNPGTNTWSQQAKLTAADGATFDVFGSAVALHGNTALIGAPGDDDLGSASGSVYVFMRDPGTNTWSQQAKLTASDGASSDTFGIAVSIQGNTGLIGTPLNDDAGSSSGSAYVFVRDPGTNTWSQQAKLTAADAAFSDEFGNAVSIAGDIALVGCWKDDDNGSSSGSAYVFVRDAVTTMWSQQQKLTAGDGAVGDLFGASVSLGDRRALVGAEEDDSQGSAYVFRHDLSNGTWSQKAKIAPAGGMSGDLFGHSVSIDGDTALIGAELDDGVDILGGVALDRGSASIYNISIGLDSDGDGIPDIYETNTGTFVNGDDTGTDPNNPDSDGDGINDGDETASGTFVGPNNTGTNPNSADSDGDGLSDGSEVAAGSNPNLDDSAVIDQVRAGLLAMGPLVIERSAGGDIQILLSLQGTTTLTGNFAIVPLTSTDIDVLQDGTLEVTPPTNAAPNYFYLFGAGLP